MFLNHRYLNACISVQIVNYKFSNELSNKQIKRSRCLLSLRLEIKIKKCKTLFYLFYNKNKFNNIKINKNV